MKIVSNSHRGDFQLVEDSVQILEMKYNNWFSGKAQAFFKGQHLEIKPKNLWSSKFNICKNGKEAGSIVFNMSGKINIRIKNEEGQELSFILKPKGMLKLRFELLDEAETSVLMLSTVNYWSKLRYDYQVELGEMIPELDVQELLIYCGYAANLYMTMMGAG